MINAIFCGWSIARFASPAVAEEATQRKTIKNDSFTLSAKNERLPGAGGGVNLACRTREGGSAMGTLDARSPREPAKITIGCRLPAGKVAAARAAADAEGKTLSMWLHELIDAKLEALNKQATQNG